MTVSALGVCEETFREWTCGQWNEHECEPRWRKFERFCAEALVHPKGAFAGKPFQLLQWQIDDLARPIFGMVIWSPERNMYLRKHTHVWFETARKQGKSHILAAILLYLLAATGEEAGEIYGAARTKDQAGIVYKVASMMVKKSPKLRARLTNLDYKKRIVNPSLDGFYQSIAADDENALGQDPSGVICDEIVAWRDRTLWDSVTTGMGSGARLEPLMVAATTPGQKMGTFAHAMHKQMWRVMMDPSISPHTYVLIRNMPRTDEELEEIRQRFAGHPDLPISTDIFDERNWKWSNPGIGDTITWKSMRDQAMDAKEDPEAENAFRVYKLAQWVSQAFRWMPMHWYDASVGHVWNEADSPDKDRLANRSAYAGLDLAGKSDLAAWCLMFPDDPCDDCKAAMAAGSINHDTTCQHAKIDVVWRFWLTEVALEYLDREWAGVWTRWAAEGWVEIHPGPVLEYERIYRQIRDDAETYMIEGMDADEWSLLPVIQRVGYELGCGEHNVVSYKNTYDRMTPGLDNVKINVQQGRFHHHGNPVARFCFDLVEVTRATYNENLIRPVKPARDKEPTRIDAVPAAVMADNCMRRYIADPRGGSAYE